LAASPRNVAAAIQNAEINLEIAKKELVCRTTPGSPRCLMVLPHVDVNRSDESEADGEVMKTQRYLGRIIADIEEFKER
jgi:hypothetical protein